MTDSLWRRARLQIATILAVGAIVGVGLWVMIALVIQTERKAAIDHARSEANNLSAAFVAEVSGKLLAISRALDALTATILRDPDLNLYVWFKEHPLLATFPIQGAGFVSPDGKLRSTTRIANPPPLDLSDEPFFRVHRDGHGPQTFVSPVAVGRLSGQLGVQVSRRVETNDGRLLGVLDFSVGLSQLTTLPKLTNIGPRDLLALVGDDHVIRARFNATGEDGAVGAGVQVPPFPPGDDEPVRSFIRVSSIDAVERLFSVREIADYPLYVAVGLDTTAVLQPALEHARLIIAIGIIATLILGVLMTLQIIELRRRTNQELELAAEVSHGREVQEQLRSSEARLRDYALMASDWLWEQDADLRFTEIGIEAPMNVGMAHIGKRRWEVNDTSRAPESWAAHERDMMSRKPFRDFRFRVIGHDGSPHYVSINGIPVYDDARQFVGYRGTGRDITKDVEAAAELQAAKERAEQAETLLRDAVDSMSEGFVIYDHEDRLIMCNDRFRELYGRSATSMVPGTKFADIVRAALARGEFAEAQGREEDWLRERTEHFHATGAPVERQLANGRWILVTESRMRNGGMAGLRIDITALKQTQSALRASEARLERAQEIAGVGSWELDIETGRFIWSKQMFRMRGVSPGTFQPTLVNIAGNLHLDDQANALRWYQELMAGHQQAAREARTIRPDGQTGIIRVEGRAIVDADGVVRRISGTTEDVTERRLLERQLSRARRMEALGNLTGGMAHDFNNGLAVIIGNLDLLKRLVSSDAVAMDVCGEARGAAMRCAELIRGLLAFARRQPLHPRPIDINGLINDTGRLLGRTLGAGIELDLQLDASLWPALADAAQLEAALINLATNARDAMPKGGELRISTRNAQLDAVYVSIHPEATAGDFVMIEVSDTGTGIAPEIVGRIFEPFFTTKEFGHGSGLGLAMVFGYVKQSGGHIDVYSEPGLGTTFRIYLPRTAVSETAPESIPSETPVRGNGETILLVEDNMALRQVAARQLSDLGYRVLQAEDPATALQIASSGDHIDLVFTDVVMPGPIDGIELARMFQERSPPLAILLTSGFPAGRVPGRPDLSSGFRLLSKPYTVEALARAVSEALRQRRDDDCRDTSRQSNSGSHAGARQDTLTATQETA